MPVRKHPSCPFTSQPFVLPRLRQPTSARRFVWPCAVSKIVSHCAVIFMYQTKFNHHDLERLSREQGGRNFSEILQNAALRDQPCGKVNALAVAHRRLAEIDAERVKAEADEQA